MIPDYSQSNPYQRLLADALRGSGTTVDFLRGGRRIFPLYEAARCFDVDVVHLHWVTPFLPAVALPLYVLYAARFMLDIALTRLSGKNVVWTIHNKVSHEARYPRLEMSIRRRIARMVDAMIVHSQEIQREMAHDFGLPLASFAVVPHASYGNTYGDEIDGIEAREMLGLPQSGRVFLNFGLMRRYKGLKRLLDAWSASGLGEAGNTLVLAGEFNDPVFREEITNQASLLRGVRLDLGRVPDERVRIYFSACDVVVLPFQKILTSGSLHLALTFGKPIVAPRLPSVSDVFGGENRFAFEPSNDTSLSDMLRLSATADLNDEVQKMQRVRTSLHDWPNVASATLSVYQRTATSRLGGRTSQ
jgi:beta-1,4-mannosyltransferase